MGHSSVFSADCYCIYWTTVPATLCLGLLWISLPVGLISITGFLIYFLTTTKTESLKVIKGVGIVLEKESWCNHKRTQFIEEEMIDQILITEVISSTDVNFYLVIVLKDHDDFVVTFEEVKPKLEFLKRVYDHLRQE